MRALTEFSTSLQEGSEDTQIRIRALEKANLKGLPNFKYGSGIMLRPGIDLSSIAPVCNPKYELKTQKPDGVDIRNVHTMSMLRQDDKELFAKFDDSLYLADLAYANHFMIINVTGQPESPIVVDMDISDQVISQIVIKVSEDCKASIILHCKGDACYVSKTVRVIQEPYSNIEITQIEDYSTKTTSFNRMISDQSKNSKLSMTKICLGSDYSGTCVIGNLREEGAQMDANVLFAGSDQQKFDIYTEGHHIGKNTKSSLLTRGALNGKAKALSRGLIKIGAAASGSQGYEKQDSMLLSCAAEADAIPNLEIGNHDVKCSHGSSIGQIDDEKVFYLMSRGMSEQEAKQKIIEGYFLQALSNLSEEHRDFTLKALTTNLERIFR